MTTPDLSIRLDEALKNHRAPALVLDALQHLARYSPAAAEALAEDEVSLAAHGAGQKMVREGAEREQARLRASLERVRASLLREWKGDAQRLSTVFHELDLVAPSANMLRKAAVDEDLLLHTGRHDNEAAKALGEVSRHGPNAGLVVMSADTLRALLAERDEAKAKGIAAEVERNGAKAAAAAEYIERTDRASGRTCRAARADRGEGALHGRRGDFASGHAPLAKLTAGIVFPVLATALKSEGIEDAVRAASLVYDARTRAEIWGLFELERDRYDILADALEGR